MPSGEEQLTFPSSAGESSLLWFTVFNAYQKLTPEVRSPLKQLERSSWDTQGAADVGLPSTWMKVQLELGCSVGYEGCPYIQW